MLTATPISRRYARPNQGKSAAPRHAPGSKAGKQTGVVLIEALIGILIFSMGILALIGLQAVALKATTQAQYRMEAQMLADQLIGAMWTSDRNTLATDFQTGGTQYNVWKTSVLNSLPGSDTVPPTVTVTGNNATAITLKWKEPGESVPHQYMINVQIQ